MSKGTMQRLTLLGRLGTDPDIKGISDSQYVAKLNVATTDRIKRKDQEDWEDVTTWHHVSAFGQLADFSRQYLKKGDSVYIEAKLRSSQWQDAEGKDCFGIDIVAQDLQQVGRIERLETASSETDSPLSDIQ